MITAIICTILLGTRTTTLHTVYRVIYCTHNDSNVHMNCEPQFGEQRNAFPHNHYSSIECRNPHDNVTFFRVGSTTTRHVLSIRNSNPFFFPTTPSYYIKFITHDVPTLTSPFYHWLYSHDILHIFLFSSLYSTYFYLTYYISHFLFTRFYFTYFYLHAIINMKFA